MCRGLCEVLTKKPKAFEEEFLHSPPFCEVASGASGKQNKGEARGTFCGKSERSERFPQNVLRIKEVAEGNLGESLISLLSAVI